MIDQLTFTESGHAYRLNGIPIPGATSILSDLGLTPPYKDNPDSKDFGTAVHKAAELRMWGKLDVATTHQAIMPYINGLDIKIREMQIQPIRTELRVYHKDEQYAGTLDLFCWIYGNDQAIFDYKTGQPPPCVELQIALYQKAMINMSRRGLFPGMDIALKESGQEEDIRRFSMQLTPDRAIVREYKDDYDYAAAIGAVRLHKWVKNRRK